MRPHHNAVILFFQANIVYDIQFSRFAQILAYKIIDIGKISLFPSAGIANSVPLLYNSRKWYTINSIR